MSNMPIADVVIGVFFMYVVLSLIVTTLQEAIASLFKLRGKNLFDAIANLLSDPKLPGLALEVYRHPLIAKLGRKVFDGGDTVEEFRSKHGAKLPSYIPSRSFAVALLDVLRRRTKALDASGMNSLLADAHRIAEKVPEGALRDTLGLLLEDAQTLGKDIDERAKAIAERVELWFNDSMGRAAGWYKRQVQMLSLVLGLVVAVGANASTFDVAAGLWSDSSLRAAVVASADQYHQASSPSGANSAPELSSLAQSLKDSKLPVGWSAERWAAFTTWGVSTVLTVLGWLATALALSLGATFWFDMLGKVLQIRGSGSKISTATGKEEVKNAPKA